MTKSIMTRALFLGAIVLGLFLAGCDTGLPSSGEGSPELNSGAGKGTVTLNVGLEGLTQPELAQSAALTVKPTNLAGVSYEATFSASGVTVNKTLLPGRNVLELDPGTYGLVVKAFKDTVGAATHVEIANKTVSGVVVSANADTNRTVVLNPRAAAGNGTFSYSITVPAGLASGALTIDGGLLNVNLASGEASYEDLAVSLPAGVRNVSVTLTRGTAPNVEYAGFSETIYIYAGLETALPQELSSFSDGDFSAQVETPIELAFAAPVTNEDPVRAISTAQYTGTIAWEYQDANGQTQTLASNAQFRGEVVYTAQVRLTARDGFTFTGIENNADPASITHEDTDNVTYANGNGRIMDITALFDETDPAKVSKTVLSAVPVSGSAAPVPLVVRPVLGNSPSSTLINTVDEYSVASIDWSDENGTHTGPFDGDTVYTATVALQAKAGFTFYGLNENEFDYITSPESVVTNPEPGEGAAGKNVTVTIAFPATALSPAQIALTELGVNTEGNTVAETSGPYTVNLLANTQISGSKTLRAGVTLNVGSHTLTVASGGTLNVAGTLVPGSGTLAVEGTGNTAGRFITSGTAGTVNVANAAAFNQISSMAGSSLAVTVTGNIALSGDTVLANGTKVTVGSTGSSYSLTVSGTISGNGTLLTGGANNKVILSNTTVTANGANFEWAAKAANAIGKLELTGATLPTAETPVSIKAGTDVTVTSGTLTLASNKTLNVLGTISGNGSLVTGSGTSSVVLANTTPANNGANLVWAAKAANTIGKLELTTPATLGTTAATVQAGTALTVGAALTVPQGGSLTVTGTIAGSGSLTTSDTGTVVLNNSTPGTNNANFEWALENAGTALNLELGANTTLAGTTALTIQAGTDVTINGAYALTVPNGKELDVAGTLNVTAGTLAVTGTGLLDVTGSALIGTAGNTTRLAKATVTKATGTGSNGNLAIANDSTLTVDPLGAVTAQGTSTVVIGDGGNTVTLLKGMFTGSLDNGALTLGTVALEATGSIVAAGTDSIVVGSGDNTVTLKLATLANATGDAIAVNDADAALTLANGSSLTLATGGTIAVKGDATVALVNSEFGAGTYTAAGTVAIAAVTAGDTITTGTTANNGLTVGADLLLATSTSSAAIYTLVKGDSAVKFAAAGITVGNGSNADASSSVSAGTNASISLGTGKIDLGNGSTLVLASGAKIGTFTGTGKNLTGIADGSGSDGISGTIGGATVSGGADSHKITGSDGVLTTSAEETITGGADGNTINAAATLIQGTIGTA